MLHGKEAARAGAIREAAVGPRSLAQKRPPEGIRMSQLLFEIDRPAIPISGSNTVFPVRRIYCIGRNYAAHSREMGSDPNREPPFFFQKPTDAIQNVAPGTGAGGGNMPVGSGLEHVWGYTLGLDMTRRDLQRAMGDEKKPWEIGKSFDHSAPVGPIHPVAKVGHFADGAIWLKVNGQTK